MGLIVSNIVMEPDPQWTRHDNCTKHPYQHILSLTCVYRVTVKEIKRHGGGACSLLEAWDREVGRKGQPILAERP
jgi:hypothetical protein